MSELFSALPDFLKEYIHSSGWDSFRDIQESAFQQMMGSDSDIIVSSGTSSGKTEAAFLPVLTSLHDRRPDGIGALYISPLKALINDQHGRLSMLLNRSDITVTGWHGDIGSDIKRKVRESPQGILQMTPESLQALIGCDPGSVGRMFSGLRFVIIDEMHAFMGSERGLQLLCCLDRLERLSGCTPRRIGLSATISDAETAEEWIRAGRAVPVHTIEGKDDAPRNVAVSVHRFPRSDSPDGMQPRRKAVSDYYRALYSVTDRNRCLLFANSRETAEVTERSLNRMNERLGGGRRILLHHGRLSQESRRTTEEALRSDMRGVTVVTTSTLEMGMDIGDMDRIVQIDAPHGCSALSQRMGRSGRRGGPQSMAILCREDEDRQLPEEILRMGLVKALAEVRLSVDEGWSEPPDIPTMPYGLLFHQTLEYMREGIGARWSDLERDVLSQYPFRDIPADDYRQLLRRMLEDGILTMMEDRTLLIGPEGERIAFGKDVHTIFRSTAEMEVRYNGERIGTVDVVPEQGDVVRIDDGLWVIRFVDIGGRYAEAEPAEDGAITSGRGLIPDIHPRVMEEMRSIIQSEGTDVRLTKVASQSLTETRTEYGASMTAVFRDVNGLVRIQPWNGSKGFRTVRTMLGSMKGVRVIRAYEPYTIDVRTELSPEEIRMATDTMAEMDPIPFVSLQGQNIRFGKYDRFVPEELLLKAYVSDRLDWRKGLLRIL